APGSHSGRSPASAPVGSSSVGAEAAQPRSVAFVRREPSQLSCRQRTNGTPSSPQPAMRSRSPLRPDSCESASGHGPNSAGRPSAGPPSALPPGPGGGSTAAPTALRSAPEPPARPLLEGLGLRCLGGGGLSISSSHPGASPRVPSSRYASSSE